MSQETAAWLNTNVLVGMTDQRGHAWHYRASQQGDEPNHYPGAIPTEDLRRRLFSWHPVSLPVYVRVPATYEDCEGIGEDGQPYRMLARPGRQNIVRSDTYADLGMFRPSYVPHDFGQALVTNVELILDDDLGVSSAGLLRGGAVAWVEVGVPEKMSTPSGVEYRPNLVATTSLDGSLATTYKRTFTAVVCDNTLACAMSENGAEYKIRHSSNSGLRLDSAREALQIIIDSASAFEDEVERLCGRSVSEAQFEVVLKTVIADPAKNSKAGATRVLRRRAAVASLYNSDDRVVPWKGSALGVLQAFNTHWHHEAGVNKSTIRPERNMLAALDGTIEELDGSVLRALTAAGV